MNDFHGYATLFALKVARRHHWIMDDLVSAANLGVATALANPRYPKTFEEQRLYVGTVIYNFIRRELEFHYRYRRRVEDDASYKVSECKYYDMLEVDEADWIEVFQNKLPENLQDVFRELIVNSRTRNEVCQVLGLSPYAVRYRLDRIRQLVEAQNE
jgi:RNA polymerase sigma factor (sigma-70 family)